MIDFSTIDAGEQVFSHMDDHGKEYHLAVDRLRHSLRKQKVEHMEVFHTLVDKFRSENGVEQHRLDRLVNLKLEEFLTLPPVIVIFFKDRTWRIADGNHRYVAACMRGLPTISAVTASPVKWAPFIIRNHPGLSYSCFSGVM